MADISNRTLSILIVVSLLISVVGLFSLPRGGLTGLGTTGLARVNVLATVAFNVSTPTVDFGNGSITVSTRNCTLATENKATQSPAGCWNGTFTGSQKQGFNVVNVGNVYLNVTVKFKKNASLSSGSTSFWGTSAGNYMWRCYATGANGSSQQATYKKAQNWTKAQACASKINMTAGYNAVTLHINITIPDTALGQKNDTLTFTGTKAGNFNNPS